MFTIYLIGFLLLYFLPCIVGYNKKHNAGVIFFINLLLGWSVIGWIVALIMALTPDPPEYKT